MRKERAHFNWSARLAGTTTRLGFVIVALTSWSGRRGASLDVTVIRSAAAAAHVFSQRTQKTRTHRPAAPLVSSPSVMLSPPPLSSVVEVCNSVWYSLSWSRGFTDRPGLARVYVYVCLRDGGVVHTGTHRTQPTVVVVVASSWNACRMEFSPTDRAHFNRITTVFTIALLCVYTHIIICIHAYYCNMQRACATRTDE